MEELKFHCALCGEENIQKEMFNGNQLIETFITQCDYCENLLNITVERKYEVIEVD